MSCKTKMCTLVFTCRSRLLYAFASTSSRYNICVTRKISQISKQSTQSQTTATTFPVSNFVTKDSKIKSNITLHSKLTSRYYSANKSNAKTGKEIDVARENPYAGLSAGEKVKEAGKDASYLLVILGGIGVMGVMFYTVGKELFSKHSPGGVYNEAFKLVKNNDEVIDILGEPIVGHGTSGSRRRRQHVNSHEFMQNGVKHMRIQFYVNGPYRKGTVHVEVYEDETKKYKYKYLIVELDGYPSRTIVIENNR